MKTIISRGWSNIREENKKREEMPMNTQKRHNYKYLKIWKVGIEIVDEVHKMLNNFPKDEKFGLMSQICRSSASIPSNIAEGPARSDKSFSHIIDISLGFSFDLETQLIIANNRNYITNEQIHKL